MSQVFHLFKQGTDAIPTNQGFCFQYLVTLERWLYNYTNGIEEDIYCEFKDDIFQEDKVANTRKFTQVKCYSADFKLQDKAVIESLIHFYDLYLTHKADAAVSFVFEANCNVNRTGISKGAKLLVEWFDTQANLDEILLINLSTFLENKMSSFINKRLEVFEEKNKTNSKALTDAEAKIDAIQANIESNDFKKFIKSIEWKFDNLDKKEAINKRTQNCYDLISKVSELEKDKNPEVLFTLLLNEVVTCSTKEKEQERCLTTALFKEKIEVANTSDEVLKSLDERTITIIDALKKVASQVDFIANDVQQKNNAIALAAEEKKQSITKYYKVLKGHYNQNVLQDELMTLADIYVRPYISVHQHALADEVELKHNQTFYKVAQYKQAYELIHDFATNNIALDTPFKNKQANVLIMLGYPGQGKTSMCNHYLHHSINPTDLTNNKVFLVRLREITHIKGLLNEPITQLLKEIQSTCEHIKKSDLKNALLILDGLDELMMKEGMKGTHVEEFCKVIEQKAAQYNYKVLLTSRYGYIDLEKISKEKYLVAQLDLMTKEEQYQWCDQYAKIHPSSKVTRTVIDSLYTDEELRYLKDLLSQPLLLHLVAVTDISLGKDTIKNKADIYNNLFTNLIDRSWSDRGQIDLLEGLDKQSLRAYLQVIALEIHKSENEYIRKNELDNLTETETFLAKLSNGQSLGDCLKPLMVSFYMNEVKKQQQDIDEKDNFRNYAIEFLHKSLHEYLAAERIWELFKMFAIKDSSNHFRISDVDEVFKYVGIHLSPKLLTYEIRSDLNNIITNDKEADKTLIYQRLYHFLAELSAVNFIDLPNARRSKNIIEQGINFCIPYLEVLNLLLLQSGVKSNPLPTNFATYWRTINCWHYTLNLRGANLRGADLRGADLRGADLGAADLKYANLIYSNLIYSNLSHANLSRANLSYANLRSANLGGADLSGADLVNANLINTNLSRADLRGTDLRGANLSRADLIGADLSGAGLIGADLIDAAIDIPNFLTEEYLMQNNIQGAEYLLQKYSLVEMKVEGTLPKPRYRFVLK